VAAENLKGRLLVATPMLREPTFARTVIAMLEHDVENGAVGLVINRPVGLPMDTVVPAVTDLVTPPEILFDGGPVGQTTAIALGIAAPGAPAEGWAYVVPPLVTVDLDHDPALLAASLQAMRVFAGYAGWAPGQLEGEIEQGAWYVVDWVPMDAFTAEPTALWSAVLRRQGWPLSAVALCPPDPSMN
jgi:putative transcriptional regulator